jgi:hypothetical protein
MKQETPINENIDPRKAPGQNSTQDRIESYRNGNGASIKEAEFMVDWQQSSLFSLRLCGQRLSTLLLAWHRFRKTIKM